MAARGALPDDADCGDRSRHPLCLGSTAPRAMRPRDSPKFSQARARDSALRLNYAPAGPSRA
jgi:hypothetical protein